MFDETTIDKIVDFCNNHFELLIYVNASLLGLFLLVYAALKLRDVSLLGLLRTTFRGALYSVIIIGQVALFILFGYLYWDNYGKPIERLQQQGEILPSTRWVKSDLRIYYIEGNHLRSVKINGQDSLDVLSADTPIKEYHFSPDGRHLLVLSRASLYLVDVKTFTHQTIDSLTSPEKPKEQNMDIAQGGSIGGIQWAPDSQKIIYELSRWSTYGGQDHVYVYSPATQEKKAVKSPTRRLSSLYWNRTSDYLYYLHHTAQDTSLHPDSFAVKVYEIPLETMVPRSVTEIPYKQATVPVENLQIRGIDLYLGNASHSFGRPTAENYLKSKEGPTLGIDGQDYLYFVNAGWFRQRLFKVPRQPRFLDAPRHQYKGGEFVIQHVRWIPGGRYVIMEHKYWGVLIMEPAKRRIGLLIQANGRTFGWYAP